MTYKLEARYDSRKSFYGKAKVIEEDGRKTLRSYTTDVAYIEDGKAVVERTYSHTTLRHIKEFLSQNGFEASSKSQILKDYKKPEGEEAQEEGRDVLGLAKMVCAFGALECKTPEEKNAWDKRMFAAAGLSFPDDWDSLSEEDKKSRLDKVKELA